MPPYQCDVAFLRHLHRLQYSSAAARPAVQNISEATQKNSLNRRRLASTPWSVNRSVSSIARLPGKPAMRKDAAAGSPPTAALNPSPSENIAAYAAHKYVLGPTTMGEIGESVGYVSSGREQHRCSPSHPVLGQHNMCFLRCHLLMQPESSQSPPQTQQGLILLL